MAFDLATAKPLGQNKFDLTTATPVAEPAAMPAPDSVPQQRITSPTWAAIRPYVEPALVTGTGLAGAAIGSVGGPAGTVMGGAGGYAAGEAALRAIDEAMGNRPGMTPTEGLKAGAKDLLMGAIFEAGGRVAAPILEKALTSGAKGLGWLYDTLSGQIGQQKAAKILRESLGADVAAARALAANAPTSQTAGQSIASLTSPTTQALLERAASRDPRFFVSTQEAQEAARINQLANLAGAETQTGAKGVQQQAKNQLREQLIPQLEMEMAAANTAGELKPLLTAQAERMGTAAANKVEDVRRMTAASERLRDMGGQRQTVERALPVPGRYTYEGELAKRAEDVAAKAAEGSLVFGEASRFASAAANSLEAHGLKPLQGDAIISSIEKTLADPKLAPGNRDLQRALTRVANDIKQWTNVGGVVDAWALDTIRKNSVNAVAKQLHPTDPKAQKELAGKVLSQINPAIVRAVEDAGGTGYGAYLKAYSTGLQAVSQKKMSAKALEMYQNDPQGFVKLVEGNAPKEVEKVFGAGSYDITKEMSKEAMATLKKVAGEVKIDTRVKNLAAEGQSALQLLLEANQSRFRLPSLLSAKATVANVALANLEKKLGRKVMQTLIDAAKSGQDMTKLLDTMPAVERNAVLRALNNPQDWIGVPSKGAGAGARGAAVNLLAPENQNNLRND